MKEAPRVLVVEDEARLRWFLCTSLRALGLHPVPAERAGEVMSLLTSTEPRLVLLDLGLPDGDGMDVAREIRRHSHVPILVVSARDREEDKVAALDAGADDYLTKPFGVNELHARVKVALRLSPHATAPSASSPLRVGRLHIDLNRRQVWVDDREVHLTPIEYEILVMLARSAGKVLTHREILRTIWGPEHVEQRHYVRIRLAALRRKLDVTTGAERLLLTEPGVGYRLRGD